MVRINFSLGELLVKLLFALPIEITGDHKTVNMVLIVRKSRLMQRSRLGPFRLHTND